jgi:PAS domain S-box-containing protein
MTHLASHATGRKLLFLGLSLALCAAVVVPAGVLLLSSENARHVERQRSLVLARVGVVRANLESALNSRLAFLSSLTAYVSNRPALTDGEFTSLARIIMDAHPGIRSVELAERDVIGRVFPLAGNERVLGLRLADLPEDQLAAIRESISRHKAVIAGPVNLLQGGVGIIGRSPIFVAARDRGGGAQDYWGQAIIVIDAERLFADAGLLEPGRIDLAIVGKDGLGDKGGPVFGDMGRLGPDPVWLDVALPIGSWRLYGAPEGGFGASPRAGLIAGLTVAAWLFTGLGLWSFFLWPLRLKEAVAAATGQLKAAHDDLERQIAARTTELQGVNTRLGEEISRCALTQDTLVASEAVLRNLYEQAPLGIFESTPDGRYLRVNAALAAMYGYDSPEDMLRQVSSITEQVYPDPRERETLRAALEEKGRLVNYEARRKKKTGEIIWVSLHVRAQRDESGAILRYEGFSMDVTRRKNAEEALRKSEARFRRLFQTLPIPLRLTDKNGGSIDYNERFLTTFGYTREDIPDLETWRLLAYPDPDYRRRVQDTWAIAARRALEDKTDIEPVEYQITCKNGDKRTVLVSGISGEDGLLATFHDVTERKRAEEALAVRERQLRVIFENSPLGLVYFDDQGAIQNCNDAFLEQMDTTRERLLGQNLVARFPREIREALLAAMAGQPSEYQGGYTAVTSGKTLYIHTMFNPVNRGQAGSEVIASVEDITAARDREEQLTRLWKIVEQSPASIVITDAAGRIQYVNPYFTVITGYAALEALGENPKILKSGLHPPEFYKQMWQTLRSGSIWRGEICNRNKSGELYWEDASISPITGDNGRITHYVAVKEDITAKKSNQAKLENALDELEAMFNASSVGIAHVRDFNILQRVNNRFQELFGYTEEELAGAGAGLVFVTPEHFTAFLDQHGRALAHGALVHEESQFRRKDGRVIWCSVHGRLINPENPRAGSIWVFDDITARKDLETLREDVERIMRHDLKGPLNGIINLPGVVAAEGNLTSEQVKMLDFVTESGLRMLDQIDLSLDIYKMELGEYVFAPSEVDLGTIVERVLVDLGALARTREVAVAATASGLPLAQAGPVTASADALLCHSIVTNIVKNAIEASTTGQTVTVTLDQGEQAVLRVHNQTAVPGHFLPVFFEKYATLGKRGGTGLGTYSAKLMTEIQHGGITVESTPEAGTTVSVSLPRPRWRG